jgi:nuclear pore complex protein Nup188
VLDPCILLPSFFSDHVALDLLKSPFRARSGPSSQSKAQFETLTSAIIVTPDDNRHYNISELKEDALWLSKEANIDEVAALRITMLEWQMRPITQLLNGASERNQSNEPRRKRLLRLHLSEELYLLKSSELLVREVVSRPADSPGSPDLVLEAKEIGAQLLVQICPQKRRDTAVKNTVNALQRSVTRLEQGSGWFPQEVDSSLEEAWAEFQFAQMALHLQILFSLLTSSNDVLPSDALLDFFRCMAKYSFFTTLQPVSLLNLPEYITSTHIS